MKTLKKTILFIIILAIIFLLNYEIYVNIDKLIPKHENEIYTFANEIRQFDANFLYDMYEKIHRADSSKIVSEDELKRLEQNETINNLIKNYIYELDEEPTEWIKAILYNCFSGKLENTIYGDLNILYLNNAFYIAYSDNSEKLYYFNSAEDSDNFKLHVETSPNTQQEDDIEDLAINKENIIIAAQKEFSKILPNAQFNPDTIMYNYGSYILKDKQKDITVYFGKEKNIIFGLYMGFNI